MKIGDKFGKLTVIQESEKKVKINIITANANAERCEQW